MEAEHSRHGADLTAAYVKKKALLDRARTAKEAKLKKRLKDLENAASTSHGLAREVKEREIDEVLAALQGEESQGTDETDEIDRGS